ncbi:MAG: hypothetical protein ACOC0P_01040, partial [Planctomycetota bacterium]
SEASDLDPGDSNGERDIFWADLGADLALYGPREFRRGSDVVFDIYAAASGEQVFVLASSAGLGNGARVPQLGGLQIDLLNPVRELGSATADSTGESIFTARVPTTAPLDLAHVQAVIRRGTGGADSVKSNTVTGEIVP